MQSDLAGWSLQLVLVHLQRVYVTINSSPQALGWLMHTATLAEAPKKQVKGAGSHRLLPSMATCILVC